MNDAREPSPISLLLLGGAIAVATALHADRCPPWCLLVTAAALMWRILHLRGRIALPGRALRVALSLALLGATLASFRTVSGLSAGSALLIVMGAAKLLETRTTRDVVVGACVALVLVLAAALDRQNLARVPAYLGAAWLALATITAAGNSRSAASARTAFTMAGRTALLALPLAALCFLLVPRLPGALWSSPDNGQGQTGLSDEMTPGSISDLALSDEIAFRVRFEGDVPAPQDRYWRGPVLHDFDGSTWRRRRGQIAVRPQAEPDSPPVRYQVMLEPHGRGDLFVLDTGVEIQGPRSMQSFDGQMLSFRPVTSPMDYRAVSHLRMKYSQPLSIIGRRLDTRLPEDRNPRALELANTLRSQSASDAAFAAAVLDYFRTGGFEYTLTPPLLGQDSVDELLFRTRLGFCGHFASAYVTLMRAGGVPARVVTGYQGGTWNAVGGYYTVRQSEAHAWAEVWLDSSGWVRIDPTSVVAPGRLQRGLQALLAESGTAAALLGNADWLRDLRDSWDAANTWWRERVVQFNQASQQSLLDKLGLKSLGYGGMILLLMVAGGVWGLLLLAVLGSARQHASTDALGRQWHRFSRLLQRRGIPVAPHEPPDAIRIRAAQAMPAAAPDIQEFAHRYLQLRFGRKAGAPDPAELAVLRKLLRRIARATAADRRPRTGSRWKGSPAANPR